MTKMIDVSTTKYPGTFALVDDEDFDDLSRFKWSASRARNTTYASRSVVVNGKKTTIRMHRQLVPNAAHVDHADGNGLNNVRQNLRPCSSKENQWNRRRASGCSRFKGVSWHAGNGKWRATIVVDKRQRTIGYFDDEGAAAMAYDRAASDCFGEFAALNRDVVA